MAFARQALDRNKRRNEGEERSPKTVKVDISAELTQPADWLTLGGGLAYTYLCIRQFVMHRYSGGLLMSLYYLHHSGFIVITNFGELQSQVKVYMRPFGFLVGTAKLHNGEI
ncbi:hypothetical protein LX32DRAFT_700303 [Colletotrichum zoysiae]|uniref:Uncharacterized protein n=1 Tax=Colletotrichum zoysiae TaxID=1216348 RepID=A0AAD9HW08_9PEZI|nr:hypothetical protein LX32DRAFT_700303 [Colletotrichum zoysiae]